MSLSIPVDFTKKTAKNNSAGGYPTQIKAEDLQKNFVYCALDCEGLTENTTGPGGFTARKLKILPGSKQHQILIWDGQQYTPFMPPPSGSMTWILGAQYGALTWIATEEC